MCKTTLFTASILASLLLSGCDKDFASLTFENSLSARRDMSGEIAPRHREALADLFGANGIDPAIIGMRTKNPQGTIIVLSEPFFGGLEPAQKQVLQKALQSIIDARGKPVGLTLTLHPQDMHDASDSDKRKAAELPEQYHMKVTLGKAEIAVSFGISDVLDAALQKQTTMNAEGFCAVTAESEAALPFKQLSTRVNDDGSLSYMLQGGYSQPEFPAELPVDVQFDDPALQSLLDQGKISLVSPIDAFAALKQKTPFSMTTGSLGEIQHDAGKIDYMSMNYLKVKCADMTTALGRPFTYHMGVSTDQLTSFRFF